MAGQWEPGKEYRTRDGKRARVYATDGGAKWSIHGAILADGEWRSKVWDESGHYHPGGHADPSDLKPPKPPVVVSDAVFNAYNKACGGTRKALAAAIAQWRSEQAE